MKIRFFASRRFLLSRLPILPFFKFLPVRYLKPMNLIDEVMGKRQKPGFYDFYELGVFEDFDARVNFLMPFQKLVAT